MADKVLEVKNVSKTFTKDGVRVGAVKNLSLEVYAGEILGIAGESGCGKSTLSRLCMGLLKPDEGEIYVCGKRLGRNTFKELRPAMQTVFQSPGDTFNPSYTVGSGLFEAGRSLGIGKDVCKKRMTELLSLTGLSESVLKRRPKELSGGQLQRLAIVRALLCEPKILIADEAVSSLDVSVSANIINLFSDLRDRLGIAVMFISHDLGVIGCISDRVAVMYSGEIIEIGSAEKVLGSPEMEYTKRLLMA